MALRGRPNDGFEDLDEILTAEAAICALTRLRDRTPGEIRLRWGDVDGFIGVNVTTQIVAEIMGDEAVLIDWTWSR